MQQDAGNGMLVQQAMQDSYARQTGQVGNHGTNARVKFGHDIPNEDDFQEVHVQQVQVNGGGATGAGSRRASQHKVSQQGLPNIAQTQATVPRQGLVPSAMSGQINYGNNISPPDRRSPAPNSGVHGRTDWAAKYLK